MKRLTQAAALLVLLPSLHGCITVLGQTIDWRYDQSADQLKLFHVFTGIHAVRVLSGGGPLPTTSDLEELARAVEGRVTGAFVWILTLDAEAFRKEIASIDGKLPGARGQEERALSAMRAMLQHLLDETRIRTGPFWLDGDGRLACYQQVTISKVRSLVEKVNALLGLMVAEQARKFEPAEQAAIAELAARGDWLRIDGQRLRVRLPGSLREYRDIREDVLAEFPDDDVVVNYDQPMVEVIFGRLGPGPGRARMHKKPQSGKTYDNLVPHVREKYGLAKPPDLEALRAAFFGGPIRGK
ncbi:MAG: hypothetical protein JXR96_26880 [Deltaproteobacteria bacterium]|nr:hypothetical protein [Deltaproteobacteria bacterium]